jgi:hypothetical protein
MQPNIKASGGLHRLSDADEWGKTPAGHAGSAGQFDLLD